MGIQLTSTGSYANTEAWLEKLRSPSIFAGLDKYGRMGVQALAKATPKDDGDTAKAWEYRVTSTSIEWYNTNVNKGANIAILIQYGHGTGTGGYIPGRDYINPAIRPVFDQIANEIVKKVKNG